MAAKLEVKAAAGGQFMFNLKAGNGEVILTSERYKTKEACLNGIESVKKNAANEKRFAKKTAKNGEFFLTLTATNGQAIGKSELYKAERSRDNGIASVQKNAPDARIVEAASA
ncbi:MAG: DUF1508 domain-containing protein [Acidobacteria bacterium]|nr:DUF1508 domain-containing protein [Acidobacteriota bacterium]